MDGSLLRALTTRKLEFQVVYSNRNTCGQAPQDTLGDLEAIYASLDDGALLRRLQEYRPVGRQGYPLRALWRTYVASFVLNLPHTNALIRRLKEDQDLRELCGFRRLPHRTTFNRFIQRLSHHVDLVEAVFTNLTDQLKEMLPDLGTHVAVDSTTVRTHSNPHRKRVSDPGASWTAKTSANAQKNKREWRFGYKLHMAADGDYGVPLANIVTTAKESDTLTMPSLIEHAESQHSWFRPSAVIADRGYDSSANHNYLYARGMLPIILMRGMKALAYQGLYTDMGEPTCLGRLPMEYIRSDEAGRRLYRCQSSGCHLAKTVRWGTDVCNTELWHDPKEDLRFFGALRRDSPEWKALYVKRQAIERVFKSMKESRRLERHCVRGPRQVTLHAMMSTLAFQATVLVHLRAREPEWMRWMVRQVA